MDKQRLTIFIQKEIIRDLKKSAIDNNMSTSEYIESLVTSPDSLTCECGNLLVKVLYTDQYKCHSCGKWYLPRTGKFYDEYSPVRE